MRIAFKEWAVVVDALGRGEQILILRKGGIHEGREGFAVENREFLLFPTLFHQQRAAVLPAAQARFDQLLAAQTGSQIPIEYYCQVVDTRRLTSLSAAARLAQQHIWKDAVVAGRYEWGKEKGIYAFAVRVFALLDPVRIPLLPSYGGCKSWVTLAEEVRTDQARPVLSDELFQRKLAAFQNSVDVVADLAVSQPR